MLYRKLYPFRTATYLIICLLTGFGFPAFAVKTWTNSVSGFWANGTNWDPNGIPISGSSAEITNANSKTVTIDASTAATNLDTPQLTLNGPPGTTNTLLLNNVGTNNPLVLTSGLAISDGGSIVLTNSALVLPLTNDHINIDGSIILNSGLIDFGGITVTTRVGRVTSGLLAINGGLLSAGTMTVGGLADSSGMVSMAGGTLNLASLLSIGRNASTTGTVSMVGGTLNVTNDDTRIGDSGIGQLSISNASAILTNVDVGRDPLASGNLTVQLGARITLLSDLSVARFSGSTGTVTITGGQILADGQNIKLGHEGSGQMSFSGGTVRALGMLVAGDLTNTATGSLTISGGALTLTGNFLVGGVGYSTGQVAIAGGAVTVSNNAATGITAIQNGTMTLNGGTLTTDRLLITNNTGHLVLNGGTIDTKGTTVVNGLPFTVGNGVAPATLHLSGGTHSFANGLVISSNATLTGCGTIIGSIINHGTIATNCSPAFVRPAINSQVKAGITDSISFTTVTGQIYTLEYKTSLGDSVWTAIPPSTNGSGSVMVLKDTAATAATRFYHIRTQ